MMAQNMVASEGMYKVGFGALSGLQLDLPLVASAGSMEMPWDCK